MQVRALTRCFVANCLRQEGEIFEYKGPGNACLEVLKEAPAPKEEAPAPKAVGKAPPAGKAPSAGKKPSIEEALS